MGGHSFSNYTYYLPGTSLLPKGSIRLERVSRGSQRGQVPGLSLLNCALLGGDPPKPSCPRGGVIQMATNSGRAIGVYCTSWNSSVPRPQGASCAPGRAQPHACLVCPGIRLVCGSFHVASAGLRVQMERPQPQRPHLSGVFDGMFFLEEWHSRRSSSQRESLKLNSVFFKGTAEARCIRNTRL